MKSLRINNHNVNLPFLAFLAELVHPSYNSYCFIIYMALRYCDILRQQTFTIKAVSPDYLNDLIKKEEMWDVNNTIVVNDILKKNNEFAVVLVKLKEVLVKRKVYVIRKHFADNFEAILSHNLQHNLRGATVCTFRNCNDQTLHFAEEVELSLINSSVESNNYIVDTCLKSYFKKPKLLYSQDLITISLVDYGREAFYVTSKICNITEKLYFKCNKIIFMGQSTEGGYLCVNGRTTVRQSVNVQSFVPKMYSLRSCNEDSLHPDAFNVHFDNIVKALTPFMKTGVHEFLPVFLLEGRKGCGKTILIRSVACHFGMNLYAVNNFEITASGYAQNETKLRNILFNARMSAPSILIIQNFENFGKNNEGEFEERLINHFVEEVKNIFVDNKFPLILFCISNDKNIPIRRIFLKTFEIKAPSDQERTKLLRWILRNDNIKTDLDIDSLAVKSHGFFLEDLRTLVYYAVTEFLQKNLDVDFIPERYFFEALDFMQSHYNESLGAPKVPHVKWSDVGGLNDVKDEIIKTIYLPLKYPNILKSSGLKRSGILLFGPPGTGKTLLAKAVATECGLCFLSVKGPELLNMYVGQSEHNVREVFERARDASPCIIFFDELDSLAPNRGASGDSGGVMDRVVSQLLAEMDGLNHVGTVYIIGATNRPDLIDPALLRPGRFDKLLYVGPCADRDSKLAVLRALTQRFHFEHSSLPEEVVKLCPEGFSGADFYGLCSSAWISAIRRLVMTTERQIKTDGSLNLPLLEDVIVTIDDFKLAINNIKPSVRQEDLDYFYKLNSEIK